MNRRDSIKNLTFLSIGAGLLLEGCYGISREKIKRSLTRYEYGRTPEEKLYDDKFFYQECSEQTKELFDKHYSEEAWLDDFQKVNKEFKNG